MKEDAHPLCAVASDDERNVARLSIPEQRPNALEEPLLIVARADDAQSLLRRVGHADGDAIVVALDGHDDDLMLSPGDVLVELRQPAHDPAHDALERVHLFGRVLGLHCGDREPARL